MCKTAQQFSWLNCYKAADKPFISGIAFPIYRAIIH